MQKAYKLLMSATVVSMTVVFNHAVAAQKDTYQVVSTSYEQPLTTFETYIGNQSIFADEIYIGFQENRCDETL